MITDKVGGSSAKPEVSKQSKEKRLKHKVSGYKSESKWRSIAGCRLLLRTLPSAFPHTVTDHIKQLASGTDLVEDFTQKCKKEEAVSAIITILSLITISILKILVRGEGP